MDYVYVQVLNNVRVKWRVTLRRSCESYPRFFTKCD